MKAFVIKNKEGKYPDDTQFQPFFTTKDIYKTTLYKNFEEAQKACRSEHYKPVEVTIAENDLEQENKELKERIQNILEGKEIPAICAKKYEKYEKQLAIREKALELACLDLIIISQTSQMKEINVTEEELDNTQKHFIEQAKESIE